MTLRVAIGGLVHETNTYALDCTGPTAVDAFHCTAGERLLTRARGTGTHLGGMIAAAEDPAAGLDVELVPTWHGLAFPSGTIAGDAYVELRGRLLDAIEAVLPVDAVVLDLHGAGVAEGVDDIEADLGRAIRSMVGPGVPLVACLDLHGNVSDDMAAAFDVLLGVHLYPHTDMAERGREAMELVPHLVAGAVRPVTHVEHLPMLLPAATTDPGNPAAAMNEVCAAVEARPGVIDCTVFHGFPFTDVPGVGVHVVCTTDGDGAAAEAGAREVAAWIWDHRDDFRPESHTPAGAVQAALAAPPGPVVINETSDNPGGGTPGDGTHLLGALLEAGVDDACFAMICDPGVVRTATAAGVGAEIDVQLGGKHGPLHGPPLAVRARVRALTDGRVTLRAFAAGMTLDVGPSARLRIGGIDVVVCSVASQTFDPEIFLLHGIDVTRYRIVALKSSNHFRAGFRDLAVSIVTADSPGLTTQRVETLPRHRAPGPLWPLDPGARPA